MVPSTAGTSGSFENGRIKDCGTGTTLGDSTSASGSGSPTENNAGTSNTNELDDATKTTWHWYYEFRVACDSHRRVQLILEITPDLPDDPVEIKRWQGETLAAIKVDTHTFLTNPSGCPVLSSAHQQLIKDFFLMEVQCVISGPTLHHRRQQKNTQSPNSICLYLSYMNQHLWKVRM